ncbi:MAG: L-asparaginase [Candidatus Cloacimonadota bacterium]|nr:MAG: L-asparaginase [Candidatus Cloacimonadota bacterium]
MKKKILIITTGGTIAMKYDEEKGIVPAPDLVEFLTTFPQINDIAEIEVLEFSNIPSPFVTPEIMNKLARLVDLKILDYDGIVITHGTDTLEESSYFLDLVLTTRKPVIFTAAMRNGSDLGLDGPRNIVGAVRAACHPESADKGVLVVMNDKIHSACDVVKTDTGRVESFESIDLGILGIIDPDQVVYYRQVARKERIWTTEIDTDIDLIKCTSGMRDHFIQSSIDNKAKAIVIEAFGRGNVPVTIVEAIKKAIEAGIMVVIVSRAYSGRVLAQYGYDGGGKHLQSLGAVLGGDQRGQKVRIKLMCLFGKYKDPDMVKKFFVNSLK